MSLLLSTRRPTARTHFVAFLLAMGIGTLVEPASAKLSSGAKTQAAPAIAPQAYSRSFLLYHHHTWKAGETIRGTMPCRAFVIGAVLMTLSVFSSPSFAAADCSWMTVRDSVSTLVWASGPALSSDGRDTCEANTAQVGGLI